MQHRARVVSVAIVSTVLAAHASAQVRLPPSPPPSVMSLPKDVTLSDVLRLLNERSPRTAADRASIEVAAADRITARTLPNPDVSYGAVHLVSGLSTGAVTQHQFVFNEPLLIFKQRGARMSAADLNVDAERARVAETLAGRRREVREAFASLVSRQQQAEVVQASLADLERVEQVVRGRAKAGDRSDYDVARIDAETEMVRIETMNAQTEIESAAGRLAALLGLPGWSPHAVGELQPSGEVPAEFERAWLTAEQRRPSVVAIRQAQAAARGGLFLAQRERLPVPAFSAGAPRTENVTGTSTFFGLAVPLPFFDRNQGAIARASAQVQAQTLALDAELAEARAEVERATSVLARRRTTLAALETRVVERVPMLRRMSEDAYREGGADILELLDALRSVKDIQIAHVQQLEMTKLAEEDVIASAGIDAD